MDKEWLSATVLGVMLTICILFAVGILINYSLGGYEYIIHKESQTFTVKRKEYFKDKQYEYSLRENVKLKIKERFDTEDQRLYFSLYIIIDGTKYLIQTSYNEHVIKELVDEIIRFLNNKDIMIEDAKGRLFKAVPVKTLEKPVCDDKEEKYKEDKHKDLMQDLEQDLESDLREDDGEGVTPISVEDVQGPSKIVLKDTLEDESAGECTKQEIEMLREKIDDMCIKEENVRIPLLEPKYKIRVYDNHLIIGVRRHYLLFFCVLTIFFLFIVINYLTKHTIVLERVEDNQVNCEIRYNFLGIDQLETNNYVLSNLKNVDTEVSSEGDVRYIFKYQDYEQLSLPLSSITEKDIQLIKAFLKDTSQRELIIAKKLKFPDPLQIFLIITLLSLIVRSMDTLLKTKIQEIIIDAQNKKVIVTFKAKKTETKHYPLSVLENIEIRQIANRHYLLMQMLNRTLNLGEIKNKNCMPRIEAFIKNMFEEV